MSLMKIDGAACAVFLLAFTVHSASITRDPAHTSLLDARHDLRGSQRLIPWKAKQQWLHKKHERRGHMLYREPTPGVSTEGPIEGCIACIGTQVKYGKYTTEDGDNVDNSYYVFKDPAKKKGDELLPIIIHFHGGGFFMGEPWKQENSEIRDYLRKGFAVVSVGYRLVSQKYFYKADNGEQKLEELIKIAADGGLDLDESGKTMEEYKVRVGKQEFITKVLFDAAAMIEHLCDGAKRLGLDPHRIVFVGESSGGAAIQYLTWVYHKLNKGLFTPRGMILTDGQLDYPVDNMLGKTWDLFVETMGAQVKLSDVVSQEACPLVVGNHMCGSTLGEASDYDLCNEAWNKKTMETFCGAGLESATLGEVRKTQQWDDDEAKDGDEAKEGEGAKKADEEQVADDNGKTAFLQQPAEEKKKEKEGAEEDKKEKEEEAVEEEKTEEENEKKDNEVKKGASPKKNSSMDALDLMEILWYTSENMQAHLPSKPFYIYVANSRNGTSHMDVAHHSIYALNFAKYAEMGKQGGLEYTIYYTDFEKMTKADRGMQRVQVSRRLSELDSRFTYPIAAIPGAEPSLAVAGAKAPVPAAVSPFPAPAPAPAADGFVTEVYNYLSTHEWRESMNGKDVEAVSLDERVLYACLAVGMGPFHGMVKTESNTTTEAPKAVKDAAVGSSFFSMFLSLLLPVVMLASCDV